MNLLDVFAINKHTQTVKLKKNILDIVDPLKPLNLHPYKHHNKGGRPKSLTDAQIIQIMLWKAEDISNHEIGRRLHVSDTTIRRYINSYTQEVHADVSMLYGNNQKNNAEHTDVSIICSNRDENHK